jgi:hypothetical protein
MAPGMTKDGNKLVDKYYYQHDHPQSMVYWVVKNPL